MKVTGTTTTGSALWTLDLVSAHGYAPKVSKCLQCGEAVAASKRRGQPRKFCTDRCRELAKLARNRQPEVQTVCPHCSTLYTTVQTKTGKLLRQFCSRVCREQASHVAAYRLHYRTANVDLLRARREVRRASEDYRKAELKRDRERKQARMAIDPEYKAQMKLAARANKLKTYYNLSIAEFEAMHEAQNRLCSICQKPNLQKCHEGRLVIDHDHRTGTSRRGKIRGLLCGFCNTGLGYFKDNPTLLIKAANYLESYNNSTVSSVSDEE